MAELAQGMLDSIFAPSLRLNQAMITVLAAIPIAIACNMHALGKPSNFAQEPYGLLDPARDEMHANERINLWWTLWVMDKRIANALNIQQAFPYRDTEVGSVLPNFLNSLTYVVCRPSQPLYQWLEVLSVRYVVSHHYVTSHCEAEL